MRAPAAGVGFGICNRHFKLAAGYTAAVVDEFYSRLGAFVVPIAPGGESAGEFALVADYDRAAICCKKVARQRNIGS